MTRITTPYVCGIGAGIAFAVRVSGRCFADSAEVLPSPGGPPMAPAISEFMPAGAPYAPAPAGADRRWEDSPRLIGVPVAGQTSTTPFRGASSHVHSSYRPRPRQP